MATQSSITVNDTCTLLDDARKELMTSINGLAEDHMEAPLAGGWSVKDVLAHVAMWEEAALPDMRRAARGDRTALGTWNQSFTEEWNRIHFALRKGFPLRQVLTELAESRRATMDFLGSLDVERLASRFIANTSAIHAKHDREHAEQIRNWRQQQGV